MMVKGLKCRCHLLNAGDLVGLILYYFFITYIYVYFYIVGCFVVTADECVYVKQ